MEQRRLNMFGAVVAGIIGIIGIIFLVRYIYCRTHPYRDYWEEEYRLKTKSSK